MHLFAFDRPPHADGGGLLGIPTQRAFRCSSCVLLLPPLALYLMLLGWINRRSRPVLMAGTWEFTGVLFAVSGFAPLGGPAFLGSLDEQSRCFWLLGQTDATKAATGGDWTIWIAVRLGYYLVVAGVDGAFPVALPAAYLRL